MAGSLNKAMLIGNLGKDPELKYTTGNKAVCNLSIATNEKWKDKDGAKQEKVEWHRVTVWGTDAENASKYLHKGSSVYVEGRIQTRSWEDKGEKKYSTEIVADKIVYLDSKGEGGERSSGRGSSSGDSRPPSGPPPGSDDDIPF